MWIQRYDKSENNGVIYNGPTLQIALFATFPSRSPTFFLRDIFAVFRIDYDPNFLCAVFVGLKELGMLLLAKFKWGPDFYKLNEELLEAYSKCSTGAEVVEVQQNFLETTKQKDDSSDRGDKMFRMFLCNMMYFSVCLVSKYSQCY